MHPAMASGISFEVEQAGIRYVSHYGASSISARFLRSQVADGVGHSSYHYDLKQVYSGGVHTGTGRFRIRSKTSTGGSAPTMHEQADVKICDLGNHRSTIESVIDRGARRYFNPPPPRQIR